MKVMWKWRVHELGTVGSLKGLNLSKWVCYGAALNRTLGYEMEMSFA
jgi:hypothetical protein